MLVLLIVLSGTAFAILRVKFEGEDLADNIASLLNKRMRGRISIRSIEWESASLKKVVTGGWVPITIRDVYVWDDCALSTSGRTSETLRTTDPNTDCTPDDKPDLDPASKRTPRKLLIHTTRITAEIDIHAIIGGNHNFVFRHIHVWDGHALLEQTLEPYPLHAYDRSIVSIISAFYPRMKAGFRAGIYADKPPPVFDLRDIHVHDLDLTVHWSPYSATKRPGEYGYAFTAHLTKVNVDATPDSAADADQSADHSYLYMDATDPLVAKFYVRLAITAKTGTIRIMDEGPRSSFRMPAAIVGGASYPPPDRTAKNTLQLVDVKVSRLAQLPTEWSRHDFVANTLELDLSAHTVPCATLGNSTPRGEDGAELHLTGQLEKYWDRPYDGTWDLKLDGKNLGPTIHTCIREMIGGDKLDGTVTLSGPFVASPRVAIDLTNVDVDVPLRRDEDPIHLTLAEVHGGIDLVNEQGYIEKTKALVQGGKEPGEVDLSATFGQRPYNANAVIEIPKAIDVGRFLPPKIRTSVGKYALGRLSAKGDVDEGFALEDFDLSLGATPTERAIRAHNGRLFTNNA
ncbi:MAG: hypothetical protein NT062_01610, partial [Proteobacteria bacterium]|nr:hypothetical protein [Pseudomonadota bacterium]